MASFPKIDFTKLELPEIPKPELDLPSAEQITDCARNAVYVGVGLAVTTIERFVDTVKAASTKVREVGDAGWARSSWLRSAA